MWNVKTYAKLRIRPTTSALCLAGVAALMLFQQGALQAHQGATGKVKERMALMKDLGSHMKAMRPMARGETEIDAAAISNAANDIAHHAEMLTTLFPKGSGGGVSEASPMIWEDPNGFSKQFEALSAAAAALRDASADSAQFSAAYKRLGETCRDCHKDYRVKKKH